jgi:hypothetical protein
MRNRDDAEPTLPLEADAPENESSSDESDVEALDKWDADYERARNRGWED